jgi:hypothetical protein
MEARHATHGIPSKGALAPLQAAHRLWLLAFALSRLEQKLWAASYPQLEYAVHLVCVQHLGESVEQGA